MLIIWLWVGERFEEVQIPHLGRTECFQLKFQIESDRAHARGKCVGAGVAPMNDMRHCRVLRLRLARRSA